MMLSALAKSAIDKVAALLGLIVSTPLAGVVAVLIKCEDGGPVFYRQRRVGLHERLFSIWKFRTMRVDADLHLGPDGLPTVPRVTRIGRLLRSASLDELPQLVNVLKGDMSIVGPRPILADRAARLNDEQRRRFEMKPGITGLAQIKGRNRLRWSDRLRLDLEYVEHWSLGLDLSIVLRTLKVVLLAEGVVLDRNPGDIDDLPRA